MNETPRKFPKIFWTILIVFFILFGIVFAKAYSFGNKVFVSHTSFFKKVSNVLLHGSAIQLKGEPDDRINILLLGYGGEGHEGTYLTDTIIVASIKPSTNEVLLSSLPRDYYWEEGQAKINAAYALDMEKDKDPNKAGQRAAKAVEKITGLDIPYFATIDFKGFEKAVDKLGGLDIKVERTFTDAEYPDNAYGYLAPLTFNQGVQHMSGAKALQFARSRHGNNDEGSDFARSKRQALVIEAFKGKLDSLNILSDTGKFSDLLNILSDHAHTNLDPAELLHLADIMKGEKAKVISQSLDPITELICDHVDEIAGYILQPCPDVSKKDIQDFFINGFDGAEIRAEGASVILENAGTNTSLYLSIKANLLSLGVTVFEVPYKGLALKRSVLYEVNSKPATIRYLEDKLDLKVQQKPSQMTASSDLVLIVGGER
jgi:LCP family protein required for cell wall assembly